MEIHFAQIPEDAMEDLVKLFEYVEGLMEEKLGDSRWWAMSMAEVAFEEYEMSFDEDGPEETMAFIPYVPGQWN